MRKSLIILSLVICVSGISCSSGAHPSSSTPRTTSQPAIVVSPSTLDTTTSPTPNLTPLVPVSAADYQQQYLQSAATINSLLTQGGYQITVIQAGYFSTSSSGKSINYLRIDMQVVNTSPDPVTLQPSNIVVASAQAQYLFDSADSNLNLTNYGLNQGVPFVGYWIFQVQGTVDPLNTVRLTFTAGISRNADYLQWAFQL